MTDTTEFRFENDETWVLVYFKHDCSHCDYKYWDGSSCEMSCYSMPDTVNSVKLINELLSIADTLLP